MCGIAGVAGISDRRLIRRMCDILYHRGPNHGGYHVEAQAMLGYRRLSIIDVQGGNQPICNENGDAAIVFNGEIYNYKTLKSDLEGKGHRFKTNSDTETILHGYEQYGPEIAGKLRGMFAFAIWDSRKKLLFIARDKFGKKPLYYTQTREGAFAFASEIKALRPVPGFGNSLDYGAVDAFLAFRFIPSPRTIFREVRKLPPAHYLTYKNGELEVRRYWGLEYRPSVHSEHFYSKKIQSLLDGAVRMRLMSEVPLGAYLSGGIDSSTVVALMARHSETPVKTFSVGFGVEKYDELKYAAEIAESFSTDHHELVVSPASVKELPKIIWHLDEPMADPTAIPTYLLSKFAKKKVTVVLTGEGGDEVFGGYEQYRMMRLAYEYGKRMPRFLRRHVIVPAVRTIPKSLLDGLFKYSSALGEKGMERFSEFFSDLSHPARSYMDLVQIFSQIEREKLYSNAKLKPTNYSHVYSRYFNPKKDLLSQMQLFDIATELPEDLLMKVDKMTMAASVEARAPLLDVPLAEFAFTIPSHMKLKGSVEKHILRRAARNLLPPASAKRKKARFFVPIDYWFGGDLSSYAEEALLDSRSNLMKKSEIRRIIGGYPASRAYAARQLWCLISLELWLKSFSSGRPPSGNW